MEFVTGALVFAAIWLWSRKRANQSPAAIAKSAVQNGLIARIDNVNARNISFANLDNMLQLAFAGAGIGSGILPGIGTVVGAVVGWFVGGIIAIFRGTPGWGEVNGEVRKQVKAEIEASGAEATQARITVTLHLVALDAYLKRSKETARSGYLPQSYLYVASEDLVFPNGSKVPAGGMLVRWQLGAGPSRSAAGANVLPSLASVARSGDEILGRWAQRWFAQAFRGAPIIEQTTGTNTYFLGFIRAADTADAIFRPELGWYYLDLESGSPKALGKPAYADTDPSRRQKSKIKPLDQAMLELHLRHLEGIAQ